MAPQKTLHNNRYPGIRSFETRDQNLFYGRNKEIDELYNYIKIKPLVVLFGKSGLGKTSLLKAGVGPLLIKQGFFPLVIRLQDVNVSPTTTVLTALEPYINSSLLEKYGGKSNNKIWEALQATQFTNPNGTTATPVLVFDQFEELFNHPPAVKEEWTSFIGDIIEERIPKDVEDAIYKIPRSERTKELMGWYTPRPLKVVFAIRSDRMSELHQLRFEIPAILQNRYELKPLNITQAKDAIERPAALTGKNFSTAPFTFAPETIEKIQKELSNELKEIESFQLQIVCQHVEQKVKEQQLNSKESIVVTPDYLGDKTGIKDILKNYYKTQLNLLGTEDQQLAARKLLEEGLIMNKRRIGVAEAVVQESYNIDDELLTKLLNSRLIRPEDTRLGRTYEISHDTLVKPILEAYEKRRVQEERLQERDKRRKEEKEKMRRQKVRNLTVVGILLALLAGWALYKSSIATKQTKLAKVKAAELVDTISALSEARNLLLIKQQELAEESLENKNTIEKLLDFASLKLNDTARTEILERIDSVIAQEQRRLNQQIASQQQKTEEIKKYSQQLFSSNESVRSKNAYTLKKVFGTDPLLPSILTENVKGKIDKKHINSVYQVIYVLENTSASALQKNKSAVEDFILEVQNSNLVGSATKTRLRRIENKLQ
jgi:hypothetical protein